MMMKTRENLITESIRIASSETKYSVKNRETVADTSNLRVVAVIFEVRMVHINHAKNISYSDLPEM